MIPEGWQQLKIGEIGRVVTGNTPPTGQAEFYGGNVPFVAPGDLGRTKYVTSAEKTLTEEGRKVSRPIPAGATLFTCIGSTIGKLGMAGVPLTTNQQINAVIPGKAHDPEFVYYQLARMAPRIARLAGTQAVPLISKKQFAAERILVAPSPEQKRIREALETWDHAIETVEALIANARAQKQALMQQLLPQGTTPPKKRLPGFSGEWREAEFNEVFVLKIGGTPPRKNPAYWDGDKATQNRWVAISDLQGKYIDETQEHISDEGVQNSNVKALAAGTVIFSFKLSIGRKAILRKSAYTNEAICALIPKRPDELSSLFVFHALELIDFTASTDQAVKGATLNKAKIADLYFSFPPRAEQDRLVEVLEDADSEIANLQSQLTALRQEKAALMQQLLTGKRRVKLPESEVA